MQASRQTQINADLLKLDHEVRTGNSRLQAWIFQNQQARNAGKEEPNNAQTLAWQAGQISRANGRIVELTLELASL